MKKKSGTRKEKKTPVPDRAETPKQPDEIPQKEEHSFPIIGIGSSAGGLEALEQFLGAVPDRSGMAFVIVQHLDPNYKGIMTELLQRSTRMPVHQVEDQMTVQPDTVYIIPPNKDMSMLHGVLYLLEPSAPRGLRLPIDFFFRSLAEDLQEQSICVILSGMGSDGTAGLRAVKEKSGLVLVQEPGSAKFDGMPGSAIESGLADIVAPAYEFPEKIISYLRHTPLRISPEPIIEEKTQTALDKIIILLRRHTGHDFSPYKKSSVYRRIERRMGIHRIDRIAIYVRFLQENPKELDILFRELLIGVTSFFRDHLAWKHLQEEDIPSVLHTFQAGRTFRCWVAGCSTGEEAYSLAIVLREVLDKESPEMKVTVQIFATDLDQDAIDKARQGFYPENIVSDIPADRLNRYFTREDGGYRVNKAIREMVIFAPQNLIMDSPFIKLDIICCRNLLIYLEPGIQKKLFPLFHYALNPGGILFLGNAESIGSFTNLFTQSDAKWRIYRRNERIAGLEKAVEFPSTFTPHLTGVVSDYPATTPPVNIQSMTDELLLKKYSPAAVLTTEKGDILYISGKTGNYLEPAAGRANWNIYAMAREGLRFELTGAFQKALREKGTVIVRNVKTGNDDNEQAVDITIQTIKDPGTLQGMLLIVFHDVAPLAKKKATARSRNQTGRNIREVELEQEIRKSRENLQIAREEMQTSQEELKSSNEELQSANEELQSTNEEADDIKRRDAILKRGTSDGKFRTQGTDFRSLRVEQ